jgi:hypothetical protein
MEIKTLEQFQKEFNEALEKSRNKTFVIKAEITAVLNYGNSVPTTAGKWWRKPARLPSTKKSYKIFQLDIPALNRQVFSDAFSEFLTVGNEAPTIRKPLDTDEMFEIKKSVSKQAIELAKYYEWLAELNEKPTSKAKQSIRFNHQEKMLALLYLGMDTKKLDNTKTAKILSAVLGLDPQNTRDYLGSIYIDAVNNPVRTKKHFENLQKSFENVGLKDIAEQIKLDIQDLKN